MSELPLYELVIKEDELDATGVDFIALVGQPAIKRNWAAFADISYDDYPEAAKENAKIALRYAEENGWGDCGTDVGKARANQLAKGESITRETIARMAAFERHRQNSQKELGDGCGRLMWLAWGGDEGIEWAQKKLEQIDKGKFSFKSDEEKRIISGPAMIADMPIYRRNDKGDEWEVVFRKPTIQRIIEKFFKQQNTTNFNLEHKKNLLADGVYLIESFMIDEDRGIKAPQGFEDLPDGTWFISCKVDNDSIWNDFVKTGKFNGFSVEGFFMEKPVDEFQEVTDFLSKLQPKLNKIFTDNMSTAKDLLAKLKLVFEEMPETKVEEKMNEAKLADGVTIVRWDGEELAEGTALNVVTEEGIIPAPDGTHELQDGRKIETKDGKVIMIESAKEQEQEQEKEIEIEMENKMDFASEINSMKEMMADCKSRIEMLEAKIGSDKEMMAAQEAKILNQSKIIAGLFEVVEKIADEPSAEAFKTEIFNTNFSEKRQNVHNRVEEIATYLKQLNTK